MPSLGRCRRDQSIVWRALYRDRQPLQVEGCPGAGADADEVPLFDYNDESLDSPGEASFEEKPDGSALVPPRVVFQAASPYRASDHDPVVVGLFAIAAPVATGIVCADTTPTNAASVQFTVTFSKDVSGVGAGDFSLTTSDVTGAPIASVTGGGATYTVTVNTGSGSRTIGLNLIDDDTIVDTHSTPLGGIGAGNDNFTGQVYTIDKTAPQAGGLVAADITGSGGATYSFTVVFSDNLAIDVASLDGDGIRATGPGGFNQLAALVSVAPVANSMPLTATYLITIPGGSWDNADNGTYTIALEANQVRDSAGNPAAAHILGTFSVNVSASRHMVFLPMVQ